MTNRNFWSAHWRHAEVLRQDYERNGPRYRALRRLLAMDERKRAVADTNR